MMITPDALNHDPNCLDDCFQRNTECTTKSPTDPTTQSRKPSIDEMSFDVHEALSQEDLSGIFDIGDVNTDMNFDDEASVSSSRCVSPPPPPRVSNKKRPLSENIIRPVAKPSTKKPRLFSDTESTDSESGPLTNMVIICKPTDTPERMEPPTVQHDPFRQKRVQELRTTMQQALSSSHGRLAIHESSLERSKQRLYDLFVESLASHQAVMDAENKAGLPRNHSRTMRKTYRSRAAFANLMFPGNVHFQNQGNTGSMSFKTPKSRVGVTSTMFPGNMYVGAPKSRGAFRF